MSDYERLRDEVLAAIAKSGKCYVNESRAMALELIEARAKEPKKEEPEVTIWTYSVFNPSAVP
jgi:hypothetical protein